MVVTRVVEVALPPLSGPPEDVFRELMEAGVLVRIWYLDSEAQAWLFFDPRPEFVGLCTLTGSSAWDVAWVNLLASRDFLGATLNSGWRIIRLN